MFSPNMFTGVFASVIICFQIFLAGADKTLDFLGCNSMDAGTTGSTCYKIVPNSSGDKVYWDEAAAICEDMGWKLAQPKNWNEFEQGFSLAFVEYYNKYGNAGSCYGPAWIDVTDKATEAGSDGTSANWVYGSGPDSLTPDMAAHWLPNYPLPDSITIPVFPPVVVTEEMDCVAALGLDSSLSTEIPNNVGGLGNLPCTTPNNDLSQYQIPPGLFPEVPFDNPPQTLADLVQWCALCEMPYQGGPSGSSSSSVDDPQGSSQSSSQTSTLGATNPPGSSALFSTF